MMQQFRDNPPTSLHGSRVTHLLDYQTRQAKDLATGETTPITLPKSNVLQFILEDGSKVSARPSGTEPKIKFYFSVRAKLDKAADYDRVSASLDKKIEAIIGELKL
jgi:phosphoglucomutase